jgi:hypothetical protein
MPVTIESAHPIADLEDQQQTITHAGAEAIRVHFASFDLESDAACVDGLCDAVYLYDADGRLYARRGGALCGFDAPAEPGDTVIVRWVSDRSVGSQGFVVDRYDVSGMGGGPDAAIAGVDAGPGGGEEGGGDDGCGCRAGGGRGRAGLGLLLLLGVVLATHRRGARGRRA